jgi:hypothetical protein
MSQSGIINASGMPTVPTSFVTDSGIAVPALNIINVVTPGGGTSGITTTGAGNTVTVQLQNRFEGIGTTIGAVTNDVVTLSLGAVPGVYTLDLSVAGFDSADPLGCGYTLVGSVRTTGAAGVVIAQMLDEFEEVGIDGATAEIVAVGNTAVIRVTGVAAKTINWRVAGYYTFVS